MVMQSTHCIFSRRNTIALLLLLTIAPAAFADKWFPAAPTIHASPAGLHGFKVIPGSRVAGKFSRTQVAPDGAVTRVDGIRTEPQTRGVLFLLDEHGDEVVLWDKPLVNTPVRVIVLDDGKHVVTVDTFSHMGWEHSLVIYGEQGQVVADFKLEDLLTPEEIEKNVPKTAAFRLWTEKADIRALLDANRVEIVLAWGRTIKIDMGTGKIE
jgi:hypothetical protein